MGKSGSFSLIAIKRVYHIELYHAGGSGTMDIHFDQARCNSTRRNNGLNRQGDVVQPIMGRGADLYYSLHLI